MRFAYQAVDAGGKVVSDTVEAPDQNEAIESLRRRSASSASVWPAASTVSDTTLPMPSTALNANFIARPPPKRAHPRKRGHH